MTTIFDIFLPVDKSARKKLYPEDGPGKLVIGVIASRRGDVAFNTLGTKCLEGGCGHAGFVTVVAAQATIIHAVHHSRMHTELRCPFYTIPQFKNRFYMTAGGSDPSCSITQKFYMPSSLHHDCSSTSVGL